MKSVFCVASTNLHAENAIEKTEIDFAAIKLTFFGGERKEKAANFTL